jgi:hypothetical protein
MRLVASAYLNYLERHNVAEADKAKQTKRMEGEAFHLDIGPPWL